MNKHKIILILSVVVVLTITTIFTVEWHGQAEAQVLLQPKNDALVIPGRKIYAEQCAICHGKNLEGQPNWRRRSADGLLPAPPHDISGHTWHHPDKLLFDLTKYGPAVVAGQNYKTTMPAFGGTLSDKEIISVLSYIKSKWPQKIINRHDRMNAAQK
jgi:S-disulfanyl-L-cysteine oxidoreductase SoxD